MTVLGSGKIWTLVPDWSRLKSSEPKAGEVTCKIGPLYFNTLLHLVYFYAEQTLHVFSENNQQYLIYEMNPHLLIWTDAFWVH